MTGQGGRGTEGGMSGATGRPSPSLAAVQQVREQGVDLPYRARCERDGPQAGTGGVEVVAGLGQRRGPAARLVDERGRAGHGGLVGREGGVEQGGEFAGGGAL